MAEMAPHFAERGRPQISALWLLAILTCAVLGVLAGHAHADMLQSGSDVSVEAAEARPGDLPLQAGRDSPQSRAALTRSAFVPAAIDSSRRKVRTPRRPPVQALDLSTRSVPVVLPGSFTRNWRPERPLDPKQPRRPFLSQAPPF